MTPVCFMFFTVKSFDIRSSVGVCVHTAINVSESEPDRDANLWVLHFEMNCSEAVQRIADIAPFLLNDIPAADVDDFQFFTVDIIEWPGIEEFVDREVVVPAFNFIGIV